MLRLTTEQKFDIILSKNRLAKTVKQLYKRLGEQVPNHVKFDFKEIEKRTGLSNQPDAEEIFESTYE